MADQRRDMTALDQFNRRADMLTRKLNKQLGGQLNLKQLQREAVIKNKLDKAADVEKVVRGEVERTFRDNHPHVLAGRSKRRPTQTA
jgi:hypothetical protein